MKINKRWKMEHTARTSLIRMKIEPEIKRNEIPYCFVGKVVGRTACENKKCDIHCGLKTGVFIIE